MTTLSPPAKKTSAWHRPALRFGLLIAVLAVVVVMRENFPGISWSDRFQTFVTIFLSIFIEAVPFLLAGSIVSGFISVFVNADLIYRLVPRNPILAACAGGGLGIIFPVCECGVVPVTRRLYQKGLPISMGIAFLLAAPVVNPVVFASTYAAFGWEAILWGRLGLSFLIAAMIGALFYFARPSEIVLPEVDATYHEHHHTPADAGPGQRAWIALTTAGDDFLEMAVYLVAGSMMAGAMQTLVPQPALLALGSNGPAAIGTMMTLAFVLSVCSTVDAFLALAFTSSFPPAAILAFLTFGPMVDIKSALMFLGVFQRRIVLYLILLPLMFTLTATVFLNFNVSW